MDWLTVLISALLGSVIQTGIIVILYNMYIIPKIVERVRDELMDKIAAWVDDLKNLIQSTIVERVDDVKTSTTEEISKIGGSIKAIISGTRGNERRAMGLAKKFLRANLPDDDDDSEYAEDLRTRVIEEAIGKFGESVVNMFLKDRDIEPVKVNQPVTEW